MGHQSLFYQVTAAVFEFFRVSTARASVSKWPATIITLVYMGLTMMMLLVLPLFGQLGPIYVQVDRFLPPDFPLLLVVPAIAIDWVMKGTEEAVRATGPGRDRRRAVRRDAFRDPVAVCGFPDVASGLRQAFGIALRFRCGARGRSQLRPVLQPCRRPA